MKTKEEIIIDLQAGVKAFRYGTYSINFARDFNLPQHKIHLGNNQFICGTEFSEYISNKPGQDFLLGNTGALLRASLISSSYERVKYYCNNSSNKNRDKFLYKESHDYIPLLQIFHLMRNSVISHWVHEGYIDSEKDYPNVIEFRNLKIYKNMRAGGPIFNSLQTVQLVEYLICFVKECLD
ncbi:MAG: hypothetical protein IT215_05750 [Chitinophagaceae bacterium]|nr:hypothetical protein [Chitinophagaceae bacterium]